MRIVDGDAESSLRDDHRLPCQRWARRVAMVALQADIPLLVGLYMFVGDDIERILWKDEDIYCSTASSMFGVPVEKHGANHELRQKGKVAVLACGYGGSLGALKRMGGVKMGLTEDEMTSIVAAWREANAHIVQFWYDIEAACIQTIKDHCTRRVGKIAVGFKAGMLTLILPSGRALYYARPSISENDWGRPEINFWGLGTARKWEKLSTYGGKLVENITQAVDRDVLAHALVTLESAGYHAVMHVHDEVICEEKLGHGSLEEMSAIMCRVPTWAKGPPLDADGFEASFYKKD